MENRWITFVRKHATKNKISYGQALRDPETTKAYHNQAQTGGELKFLRTRPREVDNFLKKHGDKSIKTITICRNPVNSLITKVLNILTLGALKKQMEKYSYDQLFHLFIVITLANGKKFTIEKNQRVKIAKLGNRPTVDCQPPIPIDKKLTINDLITNAENKVKKLYIYTAREHNCQKLIMDLLKYSNIPITQEQEKFILQTVKDLLPKSLFKLSNIATDTAGAVDYVLKGGKKL